MLGCMNSLVLIGIFPSTNIEIAKYIYLLKISCNELGNIFLGELIKLSKLPESYNMLFISAINLLD